MRVRIADTWNVIRTGDCLLAAILRMSPMVGDVMQLHGALRHTLR
jgi:hypothetical protein